VGSFPGRDSTDEICHVYDTNLFEQTERNQRTITTGAMDNK
jgi:hypothetical protein